MTIKILFLCTGNACRSQMAEGWARHLADPAQFDVKSAGIEAHGLNPDAVRVMAEACVDISNQTSDLVAGFALSDFDLVVTVCANADEKCPVLPGETKRLHWPLEDPAILPEAQKESGFRASRDDIRDRVETLLTDLRSDRFA